MKKKLIIILSSVILIVGLVVALGVGLHLSKKVPHNAVAYDRAIDNMKFEFIIANMPKYSMYWVKDGDEYIEYVGDENAPKQIVKVIDTQEEFEEVFNNFPQEVDFDKDMIVLCIFTSYKNGRAYYLKSIELEENMLITLKLEDRIGRIQDGSAPCMRCVAIKMDKIEFQEVDFNFYNGTTFIDIINFILDYIIIIVPAIILIVLAIVLSIHFGKKRRQKQ